MLNTIIRCLSLMLMPSILYAQSIDDVKKMMVLNQLTDAKKNLDILVQNPKKAKDPEVWYYMGVITNAISKEKEMSGADALKNKAEAYEAFKKCQSLDKNDENMKQEGYVSYFDLYAGAYNIGVNEYNNKNYKLSMNSFVLTCTINEFIIEKKYSNPGIQLSALDTALHINIIVTALQSDDINTALKYYNKLADAKIVTKDVRDITEDLVAYQLRKGDEAGFLSVISNANNLFPNEELWIEYELKFYENKNEKAILHKKYEELIAKHPNNFTVSYNYAVELFNQLHIDDTSRERMTILDNKFSIYVGKAIELEGSGDILARLLLNRHLFNQFNELQKKSLAIKGNKPQEINKKNQLKSDIEKLVITINSNVGKIVFFMDALPKKTPIQKANYKLVLQLMEGLYTDLKNPQKVKEYEAKETKLDKEVN